MDRPDLNVLQEQFRLHFHVERTGKIAIKPTQGVEQTNCSSEGPGWITFASNEVDGNGKVEFSRVSGRIGSTDPILPVRTA